MTRIFIDGSAGTAGLRIHGRLENRPGVELLTLSGADRRDPAARKAALNGCDIAILCLPDEASIESAAMIENPAVRVIDTSTAHRVAPGWAYGFPELSADFRERIANGDRVASTGCHAGGFVSLVYPLIEAGALPRDALLTCHSVTGYSGGGKGMIAAYEATGRPASYDSPRQYALSQSHKHLREMQKICTLDHAPVFCPIVGDYICGMVTTVPVFASQLTGGAGIETVREILAAKYRGPVVRYIDDMDEAGFIASNAVSDSDVMQISVYGNDERILLVSRFDNLGKGASGCAVQCLNIMLGLDETTGLVL